MTILRRFLLSGIFVFFLFFVCKGQGIIDFKTIDNGGAGTYKAIAIHDAKFPEYTIYRPENLKFAASNTTLPLIIFGNGDCINTSVPFEKFLNEIASFGYIIIAIGPLRHSVDDFRNDSIARMSISSSKLTEAIDQMEKCCQDPTSEYHSLVDLNNIALMGQSCGGLQALAVSSDPRVATTICLNSGLFLPDEGQQNTVVGKDVLKTLHSPILYMIGGPSDIAYNYALDDYSRINNVFVSMANYDVGHDGTFSEKFGGSFSLIAMQWFEWQLKNKEWAGKIFTGESCACEYPGWSIILKNSDLLNE
jgi:dienelactone hydrolase